MNDIARIYRAEMLRAAFGSGADPEQAADLHRLNQIAEHLAECEEAQSVMRAKGFGGPGVSILEAARRVPANVRQVMRALFAPAGPG